MKKLLSLLSVIVLLLLGNNSFAQTSLYAEGADLSNTYAGPTFSITSAGTYTVSGSLGTPSDGQDWHQVSIGSGLQLTGVTYSVSGGGGFNGGWGFAGCCGNSISGNGSGSFSGASYPLGAGTYYSQMFANFSVGNSWVITYTVTATATPPSITAHPSNRTVCGGTSTTFSISANNATSYQWQYSTNGGSTYSNVPNSSPYSGVTTTTLTVNPTSNGMNGYRYRCVASGTGSPATSSHGTLTVIPTTLVSSNPSNSIICSGGNTSFTANITSATSYQWEVSANNGSTYTSLNNTGPYSGVTTASLSITSATTGMNGYLYRCVGTGFCNLATTTAATLTINTLPSISSQPPNRTICEGLSTTFGVTASGASSYQWQISTNSGSTWTSLTNIGNYSGVTTATLSIISLVPSMSGDLFRCQITNSCGTTTSNVGTLTVNSGPSVSSNPTSGSVCAGSSKSFTASMSGASFYQWQVSTNGGSSYTNVPGTSPYSGTTSTTLTINPTSSAMNGYLYRLQGINGCTAVWTTGATLTVNDVPSISSHPGNSTVCAGTGTSFSVTASNATSYQWQLSTNGGGVWTNISNNTVYSNATTATLTLSTSLTTANGYQYRCVVTNSCGSVNSNAATLTVNDVPNITGQPSNSTTCSGGNASYSVTASSATSYQWQFSTNGGATWFNTVDGPVYSGSTTATLNITNASLGMNSVLYRCQVTNSCGTVNSNSVILTVNSAPSVGAHPSNSTICDGSNTSFSVTGGFVTGYQWEVNNGGGWSSLTNTGIYTGATTATLSLTGATTAVNTYQYRCVLSNANGCGTATSNAATLTINTSPSINSHPSNSTICAGGNTSFSVGASGTGLTYQWQTFTGSWSAIVNGGIFSGQGTATLNITGAPVGASGTQYRCVVSGTCTPSVTSNVAVLIVNSLPSISSNPSNSTICSGNNTSFSVTASGTGISYQWEESTNGGGAWSTISNGGIYGGATTNTLALTGATTTNNTYQYRCVVSGTCTPAATSTAAILTVNTSPSISSHPANSTICSGQNTSFSVSASGTSLTYQWEENNGGGWSTISNGGIYSGATSATLTLTGATTSVSTNQYRCIVGGTCTPGATSNAATLVINPLPVVNATSKTICSGENPNLALTSTISSSTFFWTTVGQINVTGATNQSGVTSISNTLTNTTNNTTGAATYEVFAISPLACTSAVKQDVVITVHPSPTMTSATSKSICSGENTSLTLTSSTGGGSTFHWAAPTVAGGITGSSAQSGQTSISQVLSNPSNATNGTVTYPVFTVSSNSCTSTVAQNVVITVNPLPVLISATSKSICSGSNVGMTLTSSTGASTFFWAAPTVAGGITGSSAATGQTNINQVLVNPSNSTAGTVTYPINIVSSASCTSAAPQNVVITTNPIPVLTSATSKTICSGDNTAMTLSSSVSGSTFFWGAPTALGGITGSSGQSGQTSISQVLTNNSGSANTVTYGVRAVSAASCTTAAAQNIVITVNALPTVTSHPSDFTTCDGSNASFGINATGTGITYQWQTSANNGGSWFNVTNGALYSNVTSPTLTITGATTTMNTHLYRCAVSGSCTPTVYSNAGILTVNTLPAITYHPTDVAICTGGNTTFHVNGNGTGVAYQWQVSSNGGSTWAALSNTGIYTGVNTTALTLTGATTAQQSYQYRCVVSGACTPSQNSNAATLTIYVPPTVTGSPVNRTICAGDNTTFTASGTGTNITYRWQESTNGGATWNSLGNGGIYSGVFTPTLTLTAATTYVNNNQYRCMLSGTCSPMAPSNAATLTVHALPAITSHPTSKTICDGGNTSFGITATGTGIGYQWQFSSNGGSTWNTVTNSTLYSGATSNTLTLTGATVAVQSYQYRCMVTGTCTPSQTSNVATITVNGPPTISSHPANSTICSGGSTSFTVTASTTGAASVNYLWQESINGGGSWHLVSNGTNFSGATTATLSVSGLTDYYPTRQYRCSVSTSCAPALMSNVATLTINTPPSITSNPTSKQICPGNNTSFSVTATGSNLTYQWHVSTNGGSTWSPVGGGTSATLNITGATLGMNGYLYRCVVSGSCPPSQTSTAATLSVGTPTSINTHPSAQTICEGNTAVFSVAPTGTNLTYQWQYYDGSVWQPVYNSWSGYSGATTNTLSISGVATPNVYTRTFRCVVSGTCGTVNSNSATMTVYGIPKITGNIVTSKTICESSNLYLNITATGHNITYQWQYRTSSTGAWTNVSNGTNYSGATTASLSILATPTSFNGYQYRCMVSGTCPTAYTNVLDLTVDPLVTPSVTITSTSADICVGTNVTFTATGVNGGGSPAYQWYLNNSPVGSNSTTYSNSGLAHNDEVKCFFTSTATCKTTPAGWSNIITTKVTQYETPTTTMTSPSQGVACSGLPVDFKVNTTWAGSTPTYQWQVNGSPVGSNIDTYTSSTLQNGDDVRCIVTSSFKCPLPTTSSDNIKMTINQTKTSDIAIAPNPDSNICDGQQITIYTYFVNGGTNPQFQWVLNGNDIPGATLPTLSISTINDNDVIQCRLVSNAICVFPETSKGVTFGVTQNVIPAVDVEVSYQGANMYVFTASPTNGGTPTYEWYVNGLRQIGATTNIFQTDKLIKDDKVFVEMKTSLQCVTSRLAGSRLVTTGIESRFVKERSLSVYPNPNSGTFRIELPEHVKGGEVVIRNVLGAVVKRIQIDANSELVFSIPEVADGMYMVEVQNKDELYRARVIIRR